MQLSLKKQSDIQLDVWVNDRKIVDSNWQAFVDNSTGDTIYIVLKDPSGQNQVKINVMKLTKFEEI